MRKISFAHPLYIWILCTLFLLLSGCGPDGRKTGNTEPPVFSPLQVLVPDAPGTEVLGASPLTLDVSNTSQGYLVAAAEDDGQKKNIQVTPEDGSLYSYFLQPGERAVIPFSSGSGSYSLVCYQQVSDSQYAALYSQTLSVALENEFLPFLYPNQYVNFTPDSEASRLALSLLPEDAGDVEGLEAIYEYVTSHIRYDEEKAASVQAGYLPDIDAALKSGQGICFDYAALMTAMLRSRDIPCRLQIGYAGNIKHAWIDVYIREKGWVEKAIAYDGSQWTRMDPTFASNSDDPDFIRSYIGDGENYTVQFTR